MFDDKEFLEDMLLVNEAMEEVEEAKLIYRKPISYFEKLKKRADSKLNTAQKNLGDETKVRQAGEDHLAKTGWAKTPLNTLVRRGVDDSHKRSLKHANTVIKAGRQSIKFEKVANAKKMLADMSSFTDVYNSIL
jgi:hypothetical protein